MSQTISSVLNGANVTGVSGISSLQATPSILVDGSGRPLSMGAGGSMFTDFFRNAGSEGLMVDGSSTPEQFTIEPASGEVLVINTITFVGMTASSLQPNRYLGLTGLGNGTQIVVASGVDLPGDIVFDLTSPGMNWIGRDSDFSTWIGPLKYHYTGATPSGWESTMDVTERFGAPIVLDYSLGHRLMIVIRDNLAAGITLHTASASGWKYLLPV